MTNPVHVTFGDNTLTFHVLPQPDTSFTTYSCALLPHIWLRHYPDRQHAWEATDTVARRATECQDTAAKAIDCALKRKFIVQPTAKPRVSTHKDQVQRRVPDQVLSVRGQTVTFKVHRCTVTCDTYVCVEYPAIVLRQYQKSGKWTASYAKGSIGSVTELDPTEAVIGVIQLVERYVRKVTHKAPTPKQMRNKENRILKTDLVIQRKKGVIERRNRTIQKHQKFLDTVETKIIRTKGLITKHEVWNEKMACSIQKYENMNAKRRTSTVKVLTSKAIWDRVEGFLADIPHENDKRTA